MLWSVLTMALILAANWAVTLQHVTAAERSGYIINIAGMQRMLSQRIALRATQLGLTPEARDSDCRAYELGVSLDRMEANHAELTRGAGVPYLSASVAARYRDDQTADLVNQLVMHGRTVLTEYERDTLASPTARIALGDIESVLAAGILEKLDAIVDQYEADQRRASERHLRSSTVVFAVGIGALTIVSFFVLLPAVHSVRDGLAEGESARAEQLEFGYRVSHNLRAPIATALGLSWTAEDALQAGDSVAVAESVRRITGALQEMDTSLAAGLTVLKSQRVEDTPDYFNVQELLDEVVDGVSGLPGFERITIAVDVQDERPVRTFRARIQQVIENLVSNAVKYHDPREEEPRIDIRFRRKGAGCEIEVTDNGRGISAEYRAQLFAMFTRFHPDIAFGDGLGLYHAKKMAESMDADLGYSPMANGSQFKLRFDSE
ncbi:MAG: ATP-binding protein [Pseudomonadota bacterium]